MARSQKNDPLYDVQQHTWNYRGENMENLNSDSMKDRSQPQAALFTPQGVNKDNMFMTNTFSPNDVYKHQYMSMPTENTNISENTPTNIQNRVNMPNYGNAMLDLGNGQVMRVYFDENNRQIMIPVAGQYELYNQSPQPQTQQPHMFTINQEFSHNNVRVQPPMTANQNTFNDVNTPSVPTSSFLKEVLGNWEPNSSGTYSPFGHYPLNHPEAPSHNLQPNRHQPIELAVQTNICKPDTNSPKRNENSPLADNSNKKRIVAEVKPMRPSYSDVLAKNTKNNNPSEVPRKTKATPVESKTANKTNIKSDKPISKAHDDTKQKHENKKHLNATSSGSESGDVITDSNEKKQKPNKKAKKQTTDSGKWSFNNSKEDSFTETHGNSQFVFIEDQAKPTYKEKKVNNNKNTVDNGNVDLEEDDDDQFTSQDNQTETKYKKKKESRNYTHKLSKPTPDKKKTQTKWKKNKPGYVGLAQEYLERWWVATRKAILWFLYLLSDVCHMSAHLCFDLCTSVFTQTYVSSQAVWRSTKESLRKLSDNKYLNYIDRRFGHTRFGFWRKIKWFKKETETENNDATKLNTNIPLPATGEEAMKRLLACKGKDPYNILGVSVSCTDDEIKRYYRRQAFLVHPDKNQQPGAEEAFKILQHAFDLIGEPERREAYDRRAVESRHVEAAWSELSQLLAQLHDKMEFAANTIRCTNCGRRHKRVLTDRPCYAARYCAQCKIRHSAKEGDIWAESSMFGLLVMYYACMDGAVYQITQWASCQKKNIRQLRADCHVVQYRIVLGNKAAPDLAKPMYGQDPNLEEFLNNLYGKSGAPNGPTNTKQPTTDPTDVKKRRNKKPSK